MKLTFTGGKAAILNGGVVNPGDTVEVDDDEGDTLALRHDFEETTTDETSKKDDA